MTGPHCSVPPSALEVYRVDTVIAQRFAMATSDRSMPPVTIEIIMAMERMPISATASSMFCRLRPVRNTLGERIEKIPMATRRMTTMRAIDRSRRSRERSEALKRSIREFVSRSVLFMGLILRRLGGRRCCGRPGRSWRAAFACCALRRALGCRHRRRGAGRRRRAARRWGRR